jgi:hypothetical protein
MNLPAGNNAVTFSDNNNTTNTSNTNRRTHQPVVANLDVDDDGGYDSDEVGGADTEEMGKEKGIQQEFLKSLHEQLKNECNFQRGPKGRDWLLPRLKENEWWIRK